MREKLASLSVTELRKLAGEMNIPSFRTLRKSELIDALAEVYRAQEEAEKSGAESGQGKKEPKSTETRSERTGRIPASADNTWDENAVNERISAQARQKRVYTPQGRRQPDKNTGEQNTRERFVRRNQTVNTVSENADQAPEAASYEQPKNLKDLDSGEKAEGILEVMTDGYGFIRTAGIGQSEDDVYVAPSQIKKFNLRQGSIVTGGKRIKGPTDKTAALLYVDTIDGMPAYKRAKMTNFEALTPVFPHDRLHLEYPGCPLSLRITDLLSPIGKGQRGMIVAQPKVGKTTLLKQIASALLKNHPDLYIVVLLIDERPEEVTDMIETLDSDQVQVVYSTFDEQPEHHRRVAEMVIERAKRMVEMKMDVVILLDSITRLTRAYNITVTPSGRTLSGGLDPAALYMPKRFFGAARAMREGGSLTILSTALVETGSRLDDVVYEEFKGTGNMELVLNRKLSEQRIFPAIDILKTSTRREDLLLDDNEMEAASRIRRMTSGSKPEDSAETVLDLFSSTGSNEEFCAKLKYIAL